MASALSASQKDFQLFAANGQTAACGHVTNADVSQKRVDWLAMQQPVDILPHHRCHHVVHQQAVVLDAYEARTTFLQSVSNFFMTCNLARARLTSPS